MGSPVTSTLENEKRRGEMKAEAYYTGELKAQEKFAASFSVHTVNEKSKWINVTRKAPTNAQGSIARRNQERP